MFPALGIVTGVLLVSTREDALTAPPAANSLDHEVQLPIASLTRKQWLDFVKVNSNGNPRTITPALRLGAFEMTVRRLCDLGVMENPRVLLFKGRQVWDADWRKPPSLKAFQLDPMSQYEFFSESIRRYADEPEVKAAVGKTIDGMLVTLSGALQVAHRAGLPGMRSWLTSEHIRQRFSDNTTSYFHKANNLF